MSIFFRRENIPERNTGHSNGNAKREDPLKAAIDLGAVQPFTIAGHAMSVR
jgi:hypothetical protein